MRRELVIAGGVAVLAAVAFTWPSAAHPASTVPEDLGDPLLQTWETAWGGHALRTDPGRIWDGNIFWPLRHSLAFSDSLLGYAPAGLFGSGPVAALVRYNLLYIGAYALAGLGAYLLGRQLGVRPAAAAVAAAAFAYAPWRVAHAGHLNVLSSGGVVLSLALLARGHGVGRRRDGPPRPGYALAGWAVGGWQLTLGFGIGLPFAYVLGLLAVGAAAAWLLSGRPAVPRALLAADAGGLAVFVVIGALLALPYLHVVSDHQEARRTAATVALFSPPASGLTVAPAENRLWGPLQDSARSRLPYPPEMTLAPGVAVCALALVGLVLSPWSRRRRLLLAGTLAAGSVLALGMTVAGGRWTYLPLLEYAPGWAGLRTPGRLVLWVSIALGLLAAGAVDRLLARCGTRAARWVGPVVVAAVLAEGLNTVPHPRPQLPPPSVTAGAGPLLVLPSDDYLDDTAMFWSSRGFPALVNGSSGFVPAELTLLREQVANFPDADSVRLLRRRGVRTVVLRAASLPGTPWAGALSRPTGGLGLDRRTGGGVVIFRLR